jgi:hypothetical protein
MRILCVRTHKKAAPHEVCDAAPSLCLLLFWSLVYRVRLISQSRSFQVLMQS